MICEDYPNESHVRLNFKGKQEWFASVRKNLKAKCNDRCLLTGTKLQQGSPPMTTDDLELLCQMLFKKNRSEHLADRWLLIFQWQLLGRISEISSLTFADVSFCRSSNYRCLKVHINRSKTSEEQELLIFINQKCSFFFIILTKKKEMPRKRICTHRRVSRVARARTLHCSSCI